MLTAARSCEVASSVLGVASSTFFFDDNGMCPRGVAGYLPYVPKSTG